MGYKYQTGLKPGSTKNFMIGPGAMYRNFDLANLANGFGERVGATKGGCTVSVDTEYHVVEIDGTLGEVQGAAWLVSAAAKLGVTMLEMTPENYLSMLPSFEKASHNTDYDIIRHNGSIAPPETNNLAVVGNLIGSDLPVIFVLENARVISGFELPLGDGKEDVTTDAEFQALYTEDNPTLIPFYILYPKGGSPVAPPAASPAPGTVTAGTTVTLTATAGAQIYYTTDGSTPTPATGTLYSGPITINATTTINAIAYVAPDSSSVVSFTYTV
ncbi:hypothetical protein BTO30_13475 [Domibacillus antri]|uniref:GH29D-like beta-sandwich domain-containing protein n=1 Tax=Domibacillus antri TaxID=1714264 RepID=A0A1Q8Q303_9BACI|nr:chitobiase/beta-hexosaminidase C-terminal domain-containing protein [Domibacillus antri]OLN21708.1 hypothetical protein BTO30_13475 [Domibacillus antri]